MKSPVQAGKTLRRWAVFAVLANIGLTLGAAVVLPAQAHALLAVLGLSLPLLTTGVLDAAADHCLKTS